ncbi:MAG: hypothetical protein CMJ89_11140 [Planctomycetes bacterium]|jgi:hypothetical protein|nr:hypothetical protein [Planctomycetota bacterium]
MRHLIAILPLLLCAPLHADCILVGYKGVSHTFEIRGLGDAPEGTRFCAYPVYIGEGPMSIEDGEHFSFYKSVSPRIYAYQGDLPVFDGIDRNHGLAVSDVELHLVSAVPEWQATYAIHTIYQFQGIEEDRVLLELMYETHYGAECDVVGAGDALLSSAWPLLPIASVLAILGLALRRRLRVSA